jgi:hypothetical protein
MIFLNEKQELRSGWKFAAYVALFYLILVATRVGFSLLHDFNLSPDSVVLNELTLLIPAIGALLMSARFVDHRPLQAFGVGFLPHWRRHLGLGLAMAAGMLAVLVFGCFVLGYVNISWTGRQVPAFALIGTLGLLLVAAFTEELIFRSFALQVLMEGMGMWPAVILMSVLFGLVHMKNPGSSLLATVNTIVAGVLLSLAYVRTRSLWLPYGIHVGWNVGLGFVLGFRLSGLDRPSLWTTGIAGSETILGGDYGPEGGLLATFIFAASAVLVERRRYGSLDSAQTSAGSRDGRDHRNREGDSG